MTSMVQILKNSCFFLWYLLFYVDIIYFEEYYNVLILLNTSCVNYLCMIFCDINMEYILTSFTFIHLLYDLHSTHDNKQYNI